MRTMQEFRERQMEILAEAFQRPIRYGGTEHGVEMFFLSVLGDLSWIDERENDFERIEQEHLWGCARVLGQFQHQGVDMPGYVNEIASTYAQVAYRLGYFVPSRLLSDEEWAKLNVSLTSEFFARDWSKSQIEQEFGPPSHHVVGGETIVACYAPVNFHDPWVFFDFSRKHPNPDDWFAEPVLRDVRAQGNVFQLLPFASWCKSNETAGR